MIRGKGRNYKQEKCPLSISVCSCTKKPLTINDRIGRFVDSWDPQWGSAQTGERPEWCGWLKVGWMGVGVGSMWPEWLKGGRWPMWGMWAAMAPAALAKGNVLSCMHFESSSKPSDARLFRLDLLDILRLRVWMPSFFIVSGLLTYRGKKQTEIDFRLVKVSVSICACGDIQLIF